VSKGERKKRDEENTVRKKTRIKMKGERQGRRKMKKSAMFG
jgi:hypothetical protein